ncbi:MAG: zinc-binding dehydrogenase, partial [Burkholderiaceae bacterium]
PEPAIPFWPMLAKDLTVRFVLVYAMPRSAHDEAASWITEQLRAGRLRHQFFRTFPLDEIVAAHEATEAMANVGKVLVAID